MASSTLIGPNIPSQKQVEIVADLPTALPPSGPAGGDLAGIYPNPTLRLYGAGPSGPFGTASRSASVSMDANGRITQLNDQAISILAAAVTDFFTQAETIRLDQFAAPTSDVSLNSHKLTGLLAGVSSTDAANVGQLAGNAGAGVGATVATADTTTSGTFGAFAHPGPAVTITTKTTAVVILSANLNNSGNFYTDMSFAISGATTLAANTTNALIIFGTSGQQSGIGLFVGGLTIGSNTFTTQGAVTGGTGTLSNRHLIVIPLAV